MWGNTSNVSKNSKYKCRDSHESKRWYIATILYNNSNGHEKERPRIFYESSPTRAEIIQISFRYAGICSGGI